VAANVLHVGTVNDINLESILIATLGAVGVLVVVQMVGGTSRLRRG
jgi:uncharacterized membrane protein YeaQ/YmgE (transglycosylase-associated protein family)